MSSWHKTFTILGPFSSVRESLKLRGWVEKYGDGQLRPQPAESCKTGSGSGSSGSSCSPGGSLHPNLTPEQREALLVTRLLRDASVDLLWTMHNHIIDWKQLDKSTIVSRFPRAYFTTKVGLCDNLQQIQWFCESGVANILFPRCYNITSTDELNAFIHDFRLTACHSLLRFVVQSIDDERPDFFTDEGKVPLCAVEFAARRCAELICVRQHEDIDQRDHAKVWDHQWDQFLTWYYLLVHDNVPFVSATANQINAIYTCSKHTVESIQPFWPQWHLDGVHNIWIVKPAAKSRGRGIQVTPKLEDILARISNINSKDPRYVVQKYIEKPLLIYNTKFDIRQWFLVTNIYPLTIWMYKESYLRFCSQSFSLKNMHESIHLSNNAVQCKYKNGERDKNLPDENMWDCYTFQTYLRTIGQAGLWETVIYPGMREGIVGTLLASQDQMDQRKNCFELFGADFMLANDFFPWLIEINSSPCMAASTSVTARMCAQVLEDVVKVVIDRREDKYADTGMFELAFKQQTSPTQPYMGQNLTVRGVKIQDSPKAKRKKRAPPPPINCRPLPSPRVIDFLDDLKTHLKESPANSAAATVDSDASSEDDLDIVCITPRAAPEVKSPPIRVGVQVPEVRKEPEERPMSEADKKDSKDNGNSGATTITEVKVTISPETEDVIRNENEVEESVESLTESTGVSPRSPRSPRNKNKVWNSKDIADQIEMLSKWKQKMRETRVNCEEVITNLHHITNHSPRHGQRQEQDAGRVPTQTRDTATEKPASRKRLLEKLPTVRRGTVARRHGHRECAKLPATAPTMKNGQRKHTLPRIARKRPEPQSESDDVNNNLYAVGMSLKSLKIVTKDQIVLPPSYEFANHLTVPEILQN
nr:PREDICTED: tubulin glycylase 3A-like isoform X2 [Bemisia tabaci]